MVDANNSDVDEGQADVSQIDWPEALREHDEWLRGIVFARVGHREAVDEVMQEVALAAVQQAAPISDASKVAPWLYRVAVRQSLLFHRRRGRRRSLEQRYAAQVATPRATVTNQDPLDWLLRSERSEIVRQSLASLAERDAEILVLKYGEGLSYQQIATHLGVSQSAVETRLHRARKRLREQLVKSEVNEQHEA